MKISLIAAVAENNAIGKDNDLLWHLPDDMQFFKNTTKGHTILTGRKNYESIPERFRPLPGRTNIVVSKSNPDFPGAKVVRSIEEGIEIARQLNEEELFIIGGGEIYRETIDMADTLYLTKVKAVYEDADTFFPEVASEEWNTHVMSNHQRDERHEHAFTIELWDRK